MVAPAAAVAAAAAAAAAVVAAWLQWRRRRQVKRLHWGGDELLVRGTHHGRETTRQRNGVAGEIPADRNTMRGHATAWTRPLR